MTEIRREGESMTQFTIRRLRNDIIEQCAKVCEQRITKDGGSNFTPIIMACADAIRSLKDE